MSGWISCCGTTIAAQLVINAMSPAEVESIVVDEDSGTMDVAVAKITSPRRLVAGPERALGLGADWLDHQCDERGRGLRKHEAEAAR